MYQVTNRNVTLYCGSVKPRIVTNAYGFTVKIGRKPIYADSWVGSSYKVSADGRKVHIDDSYAD